MNRHERKHHAAGVAPCGAAPTHVAPRAPSPPAAAPSSMPSSKPRRSRSRGSLRLRLLVTPQSPREGGFSLLELLVVVAILGILIAAALPKFAEYRAAAYDSRSQQDLRNLAAAEELYRASSPTYADDAALLRGFAPSEGVAIELESADATSFAATATHPAGSKTFRWDSSSDPPMTSTAN